VDAQDPSLPRRRRATRSLDRRSSSEGGRPARDGNRQSDAKRITTNDDDASAGGASDGGASDGDAIPNAGGANPSVGDASPNGGGGANPSDGRDRDGPSAPVRA